MIKRWAPLIVLLVVIIGVFAGGLHRYLSFETLRDNREALTQWVDHYGLLAGGAYLCIYAAVVALSLPGAVFMTLAGGFLFGTVVGTLLTVTGATIGATGLFLIAKTALGSTLRERAGPALNKMRDGFQQNAFSYLLFLRLVPAFPFWLVNLVPALLGVSLPVFVTATFLGIIPGSAVFSLTGAGLGEVFDSGESFSIGAVLTPELIAGLVGLAVLALVPVIYKRVRAKQTTAETAE